MTRNWDKILEDKPRFSSSADKSTKCLSFKLDFTPFRHEEFINILLECGLKVIEDNFQLDRDNYSVILKK